MSAQQQILAGMRGLSPPANTVAPAITGTTTTGQTLSCSTGSWTNSPSSYSYQWKRAGTPVGTNANTYLLAAGDGGSTMTCEVTATNAAGSTMQVSNTTAAVFAQGQQAYTTAGTYSWTAPAGVTSVSVVTVGKAGDANNGANGGALSYINNYAVTPGNSYTVVVSGAIATRSSFVNDGTVSAGVGSARTGAGGGNGGTAPNWAGGGAGGYAGNGGNGGTTNTGINWTEDGVQFIWPGVAGSGGGGGGGSGYSKNVSGSWENLAGNGGGGVGLLGQGADGAGGYFTTPAGGGSGGGAGGVVASGAFSQPAEDANGGAYGGAAGNRGTGGISGGGAVRIIWPGTTRQFPSTNTGNL
jgi:hypothetical protein